MKSLLTFVLIFLSLSVWADVPLLQYSWHNQIKSSQFMVFENGTIKHQERYQYQTEKIQETTLNVFELEALKKIIKSVLEGQTQMDEMEASLGSYSGTIELKSEKGLKIVEGVVRDSTDLYRAKGFRSDSPQMEELKAFIFKYTLNDMEF